MFCSPLDLRADKPGQWVLLRDLIWDDGWRIVVPAGFKTDLASIPRLFRWLLQQNGASRKAAVLHDHCYVTQPFSRAKADELFRKALIAEGLSQAAALIYWIGVRLGGSIAWANYARRQCAR